MLDIGFSPQHLSDWLIAIKLRPAHMAIAEVISEAAAKTTAAAQDYNLLFVFDEAPRNRNHPMPPHWRSSDQAVKWLHAHGHSTAGIRIVGGILLPVQARDPYSAVEKATDLIAGILARVSLGTKRPARLLDSVWIEGQGDVFPMPKMRRPVDIKALDRENKLYVLPTNASVDAALGLLSHLEYGAPVPAIATCWAAIESLLAGPPGAGDKSRAADRLADIIACSFPRAELTELAYAHMKHGNDALAAELRALSTNVSRSKRVAEAIRKGATIECPSRSHALALARMKALLADPAPVLKRVREYALVGIQRLYRLRNLMLHWGRIHPVALLPALRTATPLVGAGFDRICHAAFVNNEPPMQLAARARVGLSLISDSEPSDPAALLD